MKTKLTLLILLCTYGCTVPEGYVKVSNIRPAIELICERNAHLISASEEYTDTEKDAAIRTGELLIQTLDKAEGKPTIPIVP